MARPVFQPTEEQRRQVKALAAFGNKQEEIASLVGISMRTLRKYFRQELDRGAVEANTQVSQSLYKLALDGNVAAAIFWLKCRAKWRERSDFSSSPAVSSPFEVHIGKDPAPGKGPLCPESI
jgi:hypothetical protein